MGNSSEVVLRVLGGRLRALGHGPVPGRLLGALAALAEVVLSGLGRPSTLAKARNAIEALRVVAHIRLLRSNVNRSTLFRVRVLGLN